MSLRENVHGIEDQANQVFRLSAVLLMRGTYRFQKPLNSPLFADPVSRLNNSIGVDDDQVTRIQLHGALPVVGIGKHSDGCATRFEPLSRPVMSKNSRRVVSGIHIAKGSRVTIKYPIEQGGVTVRKRRCVSLMIHRLEQCGWIVC